MDTLPARPFVAFYDCCVPWSQFHGILTRVLLFADHIFVRSVFSEKICRNDALLFDATEEECKKNYPERFCVFITVDGNFKRQVRRKPAYGTAIKVIHVPIGPVDSAERIWKAAVGLAVKLASAYAHMRVRALRRRESAEKFREACREILEEHFPESGTA